MHQRQQARCVCGRLATITPMKSSAYEFVSVCDCGRKEVISWNHAAAPPIYKRQLDLWSDTN